MRSHFWNRRPLALKLTVTITTIVVFVVLLVTMLSVQRERQNFQTELAQQANLLLKTIAASSTDSLYFLDGDFMVDMMRDIGRSEVLTFGRIYDRDGRVVADALDATAGFRLEPDEFGQELLASEDPIYQWLDQELIAGQRVTVGSEVIGAVTVGLPTQPLTAKINSVRNQGIFVATLATIAGLIMALLLSRTITDPLQQLMDATDRVSAGDLDHRVHLRTKDELATLGRHFNRMTTQLAQTLMRMEQEIEERRRTQIELEIAKEEAETANRAKSTFLANVSHELRTPLAAIIGYSELILEQMEVDDYEDMPHKVERVLTSGNQLLRLINDILDLSKIEAGRMEMRPNTFTLSSFVEDVLLTAKPLMQKNNNTLRVEGDKSEWGYFYADESRLRQVVLNLLSNAAKFTHEGTVILSVGWQRPSAEGKWLCLSVSDTGIGIPTDQLPSVFKPFVQVDQSATRRYEGTGLGLAISQHFCQMMGGTIVVESEEGEGSIFTVRLPLLSVEEMVLADV